MAIKTSVLFIAAFAMSAALMAQTTFNVPTPTHPTIQSALNAASSGDTVMVSPGTYPERNLDFSGKSIILLGSSAANCIIDAGSIGRCFVFDDGETAAARVEGFSLRNGQAPAGAVGTSGSTAGKPGHDGGAILILNSSPTIRNCLIAQSKAGIGGNAFDVALGIAGALGGKGGDGGAIAIDGGSPLIENCIFDSNSAGKGGDGRGKGFVTQGGQPGHGDGGPGGNGGAIVVKNGTPTITGCNFLSNTAGTGGIGSASASLGGASGSGGVGGNGGAIHVAGGSLVLNDSLFDLNKGGFGGGSPAAIGGTAGSGGKGGSGGAINVGAAGTAQLARLDLGGNEAGQGGAGGDSGAFFSIFGISGRGGDGGLGGALASAGSTTADRLTMLANKAGRGGFGGAGYGVVSGPGGDAGHGGGFALVGGNTVITNGVFARNVSGQGGTAGASSGGNHNTAGAAGVGGAILGAVGNLDLASSVLWDNRLGAVGLGGFNLGTPGAPGVGAGIMFASGTTQVVNSVLYANVDGGGTPSNAFTIASGLTIEYCDVGAGWPGAGNFDSPPMFVDAANDDFHLSSSSPCRDVGNSSAAILPALDFDGEQRIICGTIDVGADEYLVLPAVPGQAPRLGVALLDINNALNLQGCDVLSGQAGPYYCQATVGGPITFTFNGQPNQPIIAVWHYLNVNNVNYGPLTGQFDIGGPPDAFGIPTALTVFADGSYTYPAPYAYTLDAAGLAAYTYTLPSFPSGVLCAFQAAIFNTTGIKMSNAVEITIP